MLFIDTLNGRKKDRIPIWIMRQAGRYLPEYRELRKDAGGFLSLCYNPDWAAEVTLQPIRRFGFDAAILFSDILVIPHALGQDLTFTPGEGPKLNPIKNAHDVDRLEQEIENIDNTLGPIYQTVKNVRSKLDSEKALIGFAGAPWTVACYMVEGGGSKDFMTVKTFSFAQEKLFQRIIDIVATATIAYLKKQIEAGANAIQIFDSWAGVLDPISFEKWVTKPTQKIVNALKKDHPNIPIIGFARGSGLQLKSYGDQTKVNGLGLDTTIDRNWAASTLQDKYCLQGNLDPMILRVGGQIMEDHIQSILDDLSKGPFVFNCGHGIIKDTPIAHVERLVEIVKNYKK